MSYQLFTYTHMRRIVYLAPVDYMRGKFSSQRQKLRYTPTGESYFDRDSKQVSASNYEQSFVAVHNSGTLRNYYQLKRRATINPTSRQKLIAAAFKACQQSWVELQASVEPLDLFHNYWKTHGMPDYVTLRGYFVKMHFDMYVNKTPALILRQSYGDYKVNNPYIPGGGGRNIFTADESLMPFLGNS